MNTFAGIPSNIVRVASKSRAKTIQKDFAPVFRTRDEIFLDETLLYTHTHTRTHVMEFGNICREQLHVAIPGESQK